MQRNTRQRRAIQETFESADRPIGPKEVLEAAAARVPGMGMATVYRTIRELLELGDIVPVDLPGESSRYELAGKRHHHHFHCRRCRGVFEVEVCNFQAEVPPGFRLETHDVVLYGLCSACAGGRKRG
jgi:Fur family transcriptional regulator, ferric uptake regulator